MSKNTLLEDCLSYALNTQRFIEKATKHLDTHTRFSRLQDLHSSKYSIEIISQEFIYEIGGLFEAVYFIQLFLSITPDGKAVMPFLDVGIDTANYYDFEDGKTTLRQLLLQTFTKVCFDEGQGFDKALEDINLIYLEYAK
jgi:hypothetical protein